MNNPFSSINPSAAKTPAPEAEPTPAVAVKSRTGSGKRGKKTLPKAPMRFRLLPLTMTMLALMMVVKVSEAYFGFRTWQAAISDAVAEEKKPEPEKEKAEGKDGEKKEKAKGKNGEEKPSGKTASGKKTATSETELKALKKLRDQTKYSQVELDLLENLAKRRDELDAREKELEIKAKVLEATDKRIERRIDEIKLLQAQVQILIDTYRNQQDADVKSLVKIYENMKPIDAAAIFNQLDMPILLSVVDKMSERKVAPILAAMDPKRARVVTEELAELRKAKPVPQAGPTP
jgi:flagellar motility protein MotE (MotC chaperone)